MMVTIQSETTCLNCGANSYGNKFCGFPCVREYHICNCHMSEEQLNVLSLLASRRTWVSMPYTRPVYSLGVTRIAPLITLRNETRHTCEAHILPLGDYWLSRLIPSPHIALVNKRGYRFSTSIHKGKDYIRVERIQPDRAGQAQVVQRDYVPQPHPAYNNGQWQPQYFDKLVKSGEVMRRESRRKASR